MKPSNRKAYLMLAGFISWAVVQLVNSITPIAFYFEGSYRQHQAWFPVMHVLSYMLLAVLFPVIYALVLYAWLSRINRNITGVALIVQTVIVFVLQHYAGFNLLSVYGVCLAGGVLLYYSAKKMVDKTYSPIATRLLSGTFLFATYIVLCLALPRFHPFAGYIMFNKFPEKTTVYVLRNKHGQLVPLEKYSRLKNDDFFAFKAFIEQSDNNQEPGAAATVSQLCQQLGAQYRANLKQGSMPFDSLTIYETTFSLQQNKVVKDEFPLCTFGTR